MIADERGLKIRIKILFLGLNTKKSLMFTNKGFGFHLRLSAFICVYLRSIGILVFSLPADLRA